jgi:hypothetical protein
VMDKPNIAWQLLRDDQSTSHIYGVRVAETGVSTTSGKVLYGIGESNEPRLLMPLDAKDQVPPINASEALKISVSVLEGAGKTPTKFLVLSCVVPDLESVFSNVVSHILHKIIGGMGSIESAKTSAEEFRSLFFAHSEKSVDVGKVAGLIGELLVLDMLLDKNPCAYEAWLGPRGERHDFRRANLSLEVKTKTRKSTKIRIHSIDQLEAPVGGMLFLLIVNLERTSSGVITVDKVTRALKNKAKSPGYIDDLLASIGYAGEARALWDEPSFSLSSFDLYEVVDGFPRLTSHSLNSSASLNGVFDIEYSVDLSAAGQFLRNDLALENVVKSLAK